MSSFRINKLRWPDEFRYALNSILKNFNHHAEMSKDSRSVILNRLSPQQSIANSAFLLVCEADEVFVNLNMTMRDMEHLRRNSAAFFDRNPFNRFQLLLRMYFYEYGRFGDIFGYFTQWKLARGLMTKNERKAQRQAFHDCFKYAIETRNFMLHEAVDWREQCSLEIGLLQGLERIQHIAVDSAGKQLAWDEHIAPLCDRTLPSLLAMGQHMQVFWNMELAHLALLLVESGKLPRAKRPYVGPNEANFLKADQAYR